MIQIRMKSVDITTWWKESFKTDNELTFALSCIVLNEPIDSNGNPLSGSNDYGIFSKMKPLKPLILEFTADSRLEIKETGLLGITLYNTMSDKDSDENQLAVLNITSEYRIAFLFLSRKLNLSSLESRKYGNQMIWILEKYLGKWIVY